MCLFCGRRMLEMSMVNGFLTQRFGNVSNGCRPTEKCSLLQACSTSRQNDSYYLLTKWEYNMNLLHSPRSYFNGPFTRSKQWRRRRGGDLRRVWKRKAPPPEARDSHFQYLPKSSTNRIALISPGHLLSARQAGQAHADRYPCIPL
jgi:hypothetical protein